MSRQLFFIEGRLLGEAERAPLLIHAEVQSPNSDLYFCTHCGDVFARFPVTHASGKLSPWQSYRSICRKCHSRSTAMYNVPGSIWRSWDTPFTDSLPQAILSWELDRHLDHLERIIK